MAPPAADAVKGTGAENRRHCKGRDVLIEKPRLRSAGVRLYRQIANTVDVTPRSRDRLENAPLAREQTVI